MITKSKILIVDDNTNDLLAYRECLEKENVEIVAAESGEDALRELMKDNFSLILMDVQLSGMNGFETVQIIKKREKTKDIPVVFITGEFKHEEFRKYAFEIGCYDYIIKPVDSITLQNKVRVFLNLSGQRKELENKAEIEKANALLQEEIERCKWTDKKNREYSEEIEKINRALREEIEERKLIEEKNIEYSDELKRMNKEKDKFFSIIAHDLRSPFQGLINLTELMAEENEEFTISEFREYSKSLYNEVKNVYHLLGNLLEWARLQKDNIEFTPKNLSLSNLASECIDTINPIALHKGISIINEVPESQTVFADERMIATVIRNLLSNSVKFTRRGGKVYARATKTENEIVEFSVVDTGVGMAQENIKKLFKMEQKIHSIGTEGEPSTGLGLLLCKEFVGRHGGKIRVESEVNKGSVFSFTLPAGNSG